MGQRAVANRRKWESWRATCLFLMMTVSQTLALNTFYTVEFPAYSFPAQEVSLVFTIEAPNASSGPAPLSLTTVLDRSESMQGRKLDLLKKTNQYLVEVMKRNSGKHDLGIVTYSNLLNELVGLQSVTSNTGPLMNYLIGNIQAAGTTYLSGGLTKGLEQQKNYPTDKVQAVYLFTDGLPNIGATTSWDILNEVRAIRNHMGQDVSIYTFGFGDDLDSNLLWDIAHEGNGVAYIISNEDDIPRAFGDAIGGLLSSVAQDVKVTFKPKDGARIKTVESPGDISVLSDGSVEVRLSNLFAQETRDILVTLEAPATSNTGFQNMLYVDTTYKDAVTRQVTGQDTVYVGINREPQPVVVVPAERVEVVKIFYITSKVLEEAGDKAENGDENGAKEKFEEAENKILQSPLQNRPRLAGLLNDIRKVREAVVDRSLNRARSGGILRNLVSSIRDQRSASTSTDQLESANALDTDSKREQREEATQGVLGDRAFAVAPAPPGPLLGPVGRAVGGAIVDNIVDRISGSDSDNGSDDNDENTDSENSDENNGSDENSDSDSSSEDSNGDQTNDSNDSDGSDKDGSTENGNDSTDSTESASEQTFDSSTNGSSGEPSDNSETGPNENDTSQTNSQDDAVVESSGDTNPPEDSQGSNDEAVQNAVESNPSEDSQGSNDGSVQNAVESSPSEDSQGSNDETVQNAGDSNPSEDSQGSDDETVQNAGESNPSEDAQDGSQSDGSENQATSGEPTAPETSAEDVSTQNQDGGTEGAVVQNTLEEQILPAKDSTATSPIPNSGAESNSSTEENGAAEPVVDPKDSTPAVATGVTPTILATPVPEVPSTGV